MRSALRKLAGPFFIGAGALHFVRPEPYRAIMPPYIPAPDAMVALSGVAEAAGGAGLLVPRTRRWAAWWLVATLVAIFPANVHMALHPERYARHVPGRARRAVSAAAVPARVHRLGARRRQGAGAGGAVVIGQRVRRREDPRFLTGKGRYVDDLELDGALWATFVRSEYAHATITEIDTSELPDGAQVFTAADIDLEPPPPMHPAIDSHMGRPPLASGKVRFVGEIIAIVVTDTAAAGVDAAERVWAEMEPLPAVTDEREALKQRDAAVRGRGHQRRDGRRSDRAQRRPVRWLRRRRRG